MSQTYLCEISKSYKVMIMVKVPKLQIETLVIGILFNYSDFVYNF
jgi:hypothetical protein